MARVKKPVELVSKAKKKLLSNQAPPIPIPLTVSRACSTCKAKKIKCDSNLRIPCSNCEKYCKKCVQTSDRRSNRPSSNVLNDLQKQLLDFENEMEQLNFKNKELVKLLESNNISVPLDLEIGTNGSYINSGDSIINFGADNNSLKYPKPNVYHRLDSELQSDPLVIYGPVSIFNNDVHNKSTSGELLKQSGLEILNKDAMIIENIKLFFQWLYPDIHMFLTRETFLVDFFHPKYSSSFERTSYCSKELVYSICSLGSLLSRRQNKNPKISEYYYNSARAGLFSKLNNYSITALQSFILLGLYDIYRGDNNSGWLLIGIGLRIGFNLGFNSGTNSKFNNLTNKFKSRIYWGCFLIDHMVSMMLGRPSVLQINDSNIDESEKIPDLEWIEEYNFTGEKVIDVSNPLKNVIKLILVTDDAIRDIFNNKKINNTNLKSKLSVVNSYNLKIISWKDELIKLDNIDYNDESVLLKLSTNPTKMMNVYYYYIVLLCLNRPFVNVEEHDFICQSKKTCQDCIKYLNIIIEGFVSKHGYEKCSILIIYSCIISNSVILMMIKNSDWATFSKEMKKYFFRLMKILDKTGNCWKLAEKSFKMIEKKLQTDYKIDFIHEYESFLAENADEINGTYSSDNATTASNNDMDLGINIDTASNMNANININMNMNMHANDNTNINTNINTYMNTSMNPNVNPNITLDNNLDTNLYANLDTTDDYLNTFGGPPLLMNSDLFNPTEWENLFNF